MSESGSGDGAETGENFVERWSRLKKQAREGVAPPGTVPATGTSATPAARPDEASAAAPAVELPDLAQLDQDSDYSAFLTPGVDAGLRRRALRQLFSSPKFNVFDGLDTYRDDFRNFTPLGDLVTADMRHHAERLAREASKALDAAAAADPPPPAVAATPAAPASDAQEPAAEPSITPSVDDQVDHRTD
jgi:hypothetical protein